MILSAQKITKQYSRRRVDSNVFFAVNETDFTLHPGDFVALEGPSGSGKSTFLSMLSGILVPDGGQVLADGSNLYAMTDKERSRFRGRKFGIIPQGSSFIGSLTVWENIVLPFRYAGLSTVEEQAAVSRSRELCEKLEISELLNVRPSELSGGENRRMAIIRALAMKPEILFADEPTADLDGENTDLVLAVLRDAVAEGAALLMATHDEAAAKAAFSRIRMEHGNLTF